MNRKIFSGSMLVLGSLVYVIGVNIFIATAGIFSSGLMGIAQEIAQTINVIFDMGWTTTSSEYLFMQTVGYWLLNLPAIILGFSKVGKKFSFKSLACAFIIIPIFMNIVVVKQSMLLDYNGELTLASQVLSAVVGGGLTGVGMGIIFKYGGSTGGSDIFATYLALFKNKSFGVYNMMINLVVIVWAMVLYNSFQVAILLLILIYAQTKAVDFVYNFHEKVTMFVITTKEDQIRNVVLANPKRTYTKLDATLGYSQQDASVLLVVLNKEEVKAMVNEFKAVDPMCFIDIVATKEVVGNFENKYKGIL